MNRIDIKIDAWRDQAERQDSIRQQLWQLIESLAQSHALDLGRLLGVTVTDQLDEALANFEDGGIQNGRTLTRTKGVTEAVAVTPICKHNGQAYCRVLLMARDVPALFEQTGKQARYILAHELGHAHDLTQKSKTIEHVALNLPGDNETPPVIWQIADVIWNEYAACIKSATEYPEMLSTMYLMLDRAIECLPSEVRRMVTAGKNGGTSTDLLDIATETIEPILKHCSHVLGHRAGLGQDILPLPSELEQLMETHQIDSLYVELGAVLATMWISHGGWESVAEYGPLLDFVRRAYAACGLNLYVEDAAMKMKAIPETLAQITRRP